jgi:hypothetical protein
VDPGRSGSAAHLLALQRSAGNRAAVKAVQRAAPSRDAPAVVGRQDSSKSGASPEQSGQIETMGEQPVAEHTVPAPIGATAPVQRGLWGTITGAVGGLAAGVRDRVLGQVAGFARRLPGYELLCTVLARDVVTGTAVPRTSAALISGFLALIPGSDRIRQQLQESGAVERAGQWLDAEVPRLGLSWDMVSGLFRRAWDSLGAGDLLDPPGAWQRIAGIFGPPLARLRDFALGAGRKMLEFVFEGAMTLAGGAGGAVMGIIRRAGSVFDRIVADPIGFGANLIAAVRGGLQAFLSNVGTHLRNGLIGWLTGALGGVIRIPQQFNLAGILGMALDFLGMTWDRVKGKLARLVGDQVVNALERGAGIVHDIYERGLSAITDRIAQFTEGIVDTVLGGIREWVTNSVVGAAITRLLSMFNPAGAVIQAVIAVYNTVQFFIERAQQLGALANAIFDSIAAIASGGVSGAVRSVEQALARGVPVVLGFLSRLIGLGDIAAPVRGIMQRVQGVIDSALDRVVGWIAGLARRVGGAMGGGRAGSAAQPGAAAGSLQPAVASGEALLRAPGASADSVRAGLAGIRRQHGVSTAELRPGHRAGAFLIHIQRADTAEYELPGVGPLASLSDNEVFDRFAESESADLIAELRRRYPDSADSLLRVLRSDYRAPHSATARVTVSGRPVWSGRADSGGSTPQLRQQMGLWRANASVHTEPKLIAQARADGKLTPSAVLWITGQYDPCRSCQGAMREAAGTMSIRVNYWWPGGSWDAPPG